MRRLLSISILTLLLVNAVCAEESTGYQIGHGIKLGDKLTLGGYFSTEYGVGDDEEFVELDDLAFLAYGDLSPNISFLAELEWSKLYIYDIESEKEISNTKPIIERLYGDYSFSDNFSVRFGKQISPIGYWNLQPINVLRETTSNPILSSRLFPKFLTGIDINGYTSFDENLIYHIYLQATKDLDNNRINIDVDRHIGISLEKNLLNDIKVGGSIGSFREVNGDTTKYLQINGRMDQHAYSLITEANFSYIKRAGLKDQFVSDIYVQGEYRFNSKHILLTRFEYFQNDQTRQRERIGIVGYGYRYQYPISFKVEYQWHADTNDNRLLTSLSVLF